MTSERTSAALLRYRVVAYVVGCVLMVLVFVAVPLHYLAHEGGLSRVVSPIHGALYIVYCVVTLLLAQKMAWSLKRTVLIMLAGTIPVMTFYAERKVTAEVRSSLAVR